MSQVVIENPVINSPFEEPARHFRFDEQGITNTIVPVRRISQYFVPIAKPRKTAKERQMTFDEWTEDRIEENKTFRRREKIKAATLTKAIVHQGEDSEIRDPWDAKKQILSHRNG